MKTLILVRHAKSSWEFDVGDRDRPLKKRGINDANLVSNDFKKDNFQPDVVFSSPANRAYSTCKIFVDNLNLPKDKIQITEQLYDFGGHGVLNFVKNLNDELDKVIIFGHNHAFTSVSNQLGNRDIENLPTSGLVKINFEIDSWHDLQPGDTELIITPRDLKTP